MEKMTHKEAQRMLAEEMVEMLKSDNGGPLKWNETKLHLMEVVRYVFVSEMLKDEMGIPLSQSVIAHRVFGLFGVSSPRNISGYLLRLNNIKGVKSQRLVDMMVYKTNVLHVRVSLSSFIRSGE